MDNQDSKVEVSRKETDFTVNNYPGWKGGYYTVSSIIFLVFYNESVWAGFYILAIRKETNHKIPGKRL